jgi:uncharacterized membrane protein
VTPGGGAAPFSIGESVSYGWNAYWKNVGPMLLITLVILAVTLVVNLVGNAADNSGVRILFSVIGWIVGLLLAYGLIRASLAVTRGEKPEVAMLFQGQNFGPYLVASILFGIGAAIGFLLCIVPGIIFVVIFWFYGYVICEAPEGISATDALSRAAQLSKDKRWELFGLGVVLFLINLVGAILCGVGLLFTYGITALAVAYAYRSLSGQSVVQPG